MKKLCLSFDVEEFDVLYLKGLCSEKERFDLSAHGVLNILTVLRSTNCKSTFFITKSFAERKPEIVRQIISDGHEIGSHGFEHKDDYSLMEVGNALDKLKLCREYFLEKFGVNLKGFRAPKLKHPDYEIIKKAGFEYDSSYHPIFIPGRYNHIFGNRDIHYKAGIKVIPVSVTWFGASWVWIFFRWFGLWYVKLCSVLFDKQIINIYFHPWEFIDLSSYNIPFYYKKNSSHKLMNMLEEYVLWCKNKGWAVKTLGEI